MKNEKGILPLIIVIVIGIIAIGGVLAYQYYSQIPEEEVEEEVEELIDETAEEESYIKVISPNGGEEWEIGETYDITWKSEEVNKIHILLAQKGTEHLEPSPEIWKAPSEGGIDQPCGAFIRIAKNISASLNKYSYAVSEGTCLDQEYKVKVYVALSATQYGNLLDQSDDYFTIIKKDETADREIYRNEELGIEFKYPKILKLTKENDKIILNHSILYENYGACDMAGEGNTYETLDDFNVSIRIENGTVNPPYIDGSYMVGIDPLYVGGLYNTSDLVGDFFYEGAEGCGVIIYYFHIGDKTLVVEKSTVQALSGISTSWDLEEILKVPGVITSEESEEIFREILFTFKFID